MDDRLMYSRDPEITWEVFLLVRPENSIEGGLIDLLREKDEDGLLLKEVTEYKAALRTIDQLKISGEYEAYQQKVLFLVEKANSRALDNFVMENPGIKSKIARYDSDIQASDGTIDRELRNLFDGLKSPNPQQRERFRKMYEQLGLAQKTYPEIKDVLPALERVKGKPGRGKLLTPWSNEFGAMDFMRDLLAANPRTAISDAARQADQADPRSNAPNRPKRLERLYAQKMALRN